MMDLGQKHPSRTPAPCFTKPAWPKSAPRSDSKLHPAAGTLWFLALAFFLGLTACVAAPSQPLNATEAGRPQKLTGPATLLPILDSRRAPDAETAPQLEQAGAFLDVPSVQIMDLGWARWEREGLAQDLIRYQGPQPSPAPFKWSEFPLRGLTTDLALGLEVKNLVLRKTGHNALIGPHAILDGVLLPLFAAGLAVSGGHLDLGGRVFPSAMVDVVLDMDVVFISRKAGGPVYTKTYRQRRIDDWVSENDLYAGVRPNPQDGRERGALGTAEVVDRLFTLAARDPELGLIDEYAGLGWLKSVLEDDDIPAERKSQAIRRQADSIVPPAITMDQWRILYDPFTPAADRIEDARGLSVPGAQPAVLPTESEMTAPWLEETGGRLRLFESAFTSLVQAAGRLRSRSMTQHLTPAETALDAEIQGWLKGWLPLPAAMALVREGVENGSRPRAERLVLFRLLLDQPDSGQAEAVRQAAEAHFSNELDKNPAGAEDAAAFLVEALGPLAVDDYPIPRRTLFTVLSGADTWAEPVVRRAVAEGDLGPDILRLTAAMDLRDAVPNLAQALEKWIFPLNRPQKRDQTPSIPLLPMPPSAERRPSPSPRELARTLGAFPGDPMAESALEALFAQWQTDIGVPEEAVAEAVRSFGRMNRRDLAAGLAQFWKEWAETDQSADLRRAALEALVRIGGPREFQLVEETGRRLRARRQFGPVREAADFFGAAAWPAAVGFLKETAADPAAPEPVQTAALAALARLATEPARAALQGLYDHQGGRLAEEAGRWLEELVRRRARWAELGNPS